MAHSCGHDTVYSNCLVSRSAFWAQSITKDYIGTEVCSKRYQVTRYIFWRELVKHKGDWTRKSEFRKAETLTVGEAYKSIQTCSRVNEKIFDSSWISEKVTLISASAAPNHGHCTETTEGKVIQHKASFLQTLAVLRLRPVVSSLFKNIITQTPWRKSCNFGK